VNSKAFVLAALQIPNRTFPVIAEPAPAPLVLVEVVATVQVDTIVIVVADTALDVMEDIVIEALLLLDDTMMITTAAAIVPRHELELQSMTTLPPAVVVSMIRIVATTPLPIHMSMAMVDHLQETTLRETILPEMLAMLIMIVVVATKCCLPSKYVLCDDGMEALLHDASW